MGKPRGKDTLTADIKKIKEYPAAEECDYSEGEEQGREPAVHYCHMVSGEGGGTENHRKARRGFFFQCYIGKSAEEKFFKKRVAKRDVERDEWEDLLCYSAVFHKSLGDRREVDVGAEKKISAEDQHKRAKSKREPCEYRALVRSQNCEG